MKGQRVVSLEGRVSGLCAAYDELMTLLELNQHANTLQQSQNLHKSIVNKLTELREKLSSLPQRKTSGAVQQYEKKWEKLQRSGLELQLEWAEEEGRKRGRREWVGEVQEMRDKIRANVEQSGERLAVQLGRWRGRTEEKVLRGGEGQECEKLLHEVELMRLQLPMPPFSDFFAFTCVNLRNQMSRLMEESDQEGKKLRMPMLQCRLFGLKKHAIEELILTYAQRDNKWEVSQLQQQINHQVAQLDKLYSTLLSAIGNFH